jgi:hypothetical protein
MKVVHASFIALLFLSAHAFGIELSGAWRVVEWSAGDPHPETVTMLFEKSGELRTITSSPGLGARTEVSHFEVVGNELLITNSAGEVSHHRLEVAGGRVKVLVPFGFFVMVGASNNSLKADGTDVPPP